MPFCPVCRRGYNPGTTTCPDCDAELVPVLDEPGKFSDDVEWVRVADYRFTHEAEEARLRLEADGIKAVAMDETASRVGCLWTSGEGARVIMRKEDAPRAANILRG